MSGEVALRKAVREDIGKVGKDGVAVYAMNYLGRVLVTGSAGISLRRLCVLQMRRCLTAVLNSIIRASIFISVM